MKPSRSAPGAGSNREGDDPVAFAVRMEASGELIQSSELQSEIGRSNGHATLSDDRPEVVIGTDEHLTNDAALNALALDPDLYQRGGMLVHVVRDKGSESSGITRPSDALRIAKLPDAVLRERLTKAARFVKIVEKKNGRTASKDAHPPDWCVKALFKRGQYSQIRRLEGIVESPVLRPDGSILDTPGYDAATGLLYVQSGAQLSLPTSPTKEDAITALECLLDIVADFPFDKDAHRSAWLAAMLSPIARPAFEGPVPLFLLDANAPGSGKTLLCSATAVVNTGKPELPAMANPRNDDECRKRITAIAECGDPVILIDNVSGHFGFPSLDAALTATRWRDRILGRSEMVEFPLRSVWFATANNATIAGDTARRICHIRLNCKHENPEEREDFRHPNLLEYVRQNRDELLAAALTILRAYYVAGRPKTKLKPWGSFEGWSDLIRQCIVWLELEDPADTRQELRAVADQDTTVLRTLLAGLSEADPSGEGLSTAAILKSIEPIKPKDGQSYIPVGCETLSAAVHDLCDTTPAKPPGSRTLGNRLRKFRGRIIGGRALGGKPDGDGFIRWKVDSASESADSPESIFNPAQEKSESEQMHFPREGTETDSLDSADSGLETDDVPF